MNNQPQPEIIDTSKVEVNYDYNRQDHGGLVTNHNGVADRLLQNNDLYRAMKGDWQRTAWNASQNIRTTTGREDGKFYIKREQMNVAAVARRCAEYRKAAEQGYHDPLAPVMDDGKLGYKWMDLPHVISLEISEQWFGGMPWSVIKHDRTLKAQFYQVVEKYYPQFICYPGGKLPLPIRPAIPSRVGGDRTHFFKGTS